MSRSVWTAACSPPLFARAESYLKSVNFRPPESGAKATAVQTLRDGPAFSNFAKRLDCGAFTAAFCPHGKFSDEEAPRARESGVAAAALPPQSKMRTATMRRKIF